MAKLTTTNITSGYDAVDTINANFAAVVTALENTLSRDGTTPNMMTADLDMNSKRVLNLIDAVNSSEPVTLSQLNAASIVATTAAATAVTLADAGNNYDATTVEAAFTELASTSSGQGASIIGVFDTAGNFTGADVEAVLAELSASQVSENTDITVNALFLNEQATASADVAGDGQIWVLTASPNVLRFTDDAGTDWTILTDNLAFSMQDKELTRPKIKDYSLTSTSVASASNVIELDMEDSNSFETTLTENITTVTLSNPAATGSYCELIWKVTQDSTTRSITFPASVQWPGGTAPTISTGSGDVDIITLKTWDAGTTWYGNFSQAYA